MTLFLLFPLVGLAFLFLIGWLIFVLANAKDSASFHTKIRIIYMYAISFITLIFLIIGIVGTFNQVLELCFPTNAEYTNLSDLFGFGTCLIVSLPVFIYHIKTATKARKGE